MISSPANENTTGAMVQHSEDDRHGFESQAEDLMHIPTVVTQLETPRRTLCLCTTGEESG